LAEHALDRFDEIGGAVVNRQDDADARYAEILCR
jgi:hypothetical protein